MIPEKYKKLGFTQLNSPKKTPNASKSHAVLIKDDGKYKLIRFGQQGVSGSPKKNGESEASKNRREAFKARHAANIAKGKTSAAYWANKVKWQYGGEIPKFADGGDVQDPPLNQYQQYFKEWITNPEYKNRLIKNGYSNVDNVIKDRLNGVLNSSLNTTTSQPSWAGDPNKVWVNPSDDVNYDAIAAHEYAHKAGASNDRNLKNKNLTLSDKEYNMIAIPNRMNKNNESHYSDSNEVKSDIDSLRFLMRNNFISNGNDNTIDKSMLNKAKTDKTINNSEVIRRLSKEYNDDDLIKLLNTVAQNDQQQLPAAKNGGSFRRLNKFADGGGICYNAVGQVIPCPQNTSQPTMDVKNLSLESLGIKSNLPTKNIAESTKGSLLYDVADQQRRVMNQSLAQIPTIRQNQEDTPLSTFTTQQKNRNYVVNNPYSKLDNKGNIQRADYDRSITGQPDNYTPAKRFDEGMNTAMQGIDAAGYVTGAGELASLGVNAAKQALIRSTEDGLLSNAYKLNSYAFKPPVKNGIDPLAIVDALTPRINPFSFISDGGDLMSMSPLNLIPGYGRTLSGKNQAFRKFGNSIQDVIDRQALSPAGGSKFRMGRDQIVNEGNWAATNKPWEKYPGTFEATIDPKIEGSNLNFTSKSGRNGVLITDKDRNLLPEIPLTDPGLSFNRRLPFSNRYVSINKDKLINNQFQMATFAPRIQSIGEKVGVGYGIAGIHDYMDNDPNSEWIPTLNKYITNPAKKYVGDAIDYGKQLDKSLGIEYKKGGNINNIKNNNWLNKYN